MDGKKHTVGPKQQLAIDAHRNNQIKALSGYVTQGKIPSRMQYSQQHMSLPVKNDSNPHLKTTTSFRSSVSHLTKATELQ